MITADKHIIYKLVVDVDFYGAEADAFACQQWISRFCREELPNLLETMLHSWEDEGTIVRIPHLEIELESIREEDLGQQLAPALINAISAKAIRDVEVDPPEQEDRVLLSLEEAALEIWLFFLQHGSLPTWSQVPSMADLEDKVAVLLKSSSSTITPLLPEIRQVLQQPVARQRLALQGSPNLIWRLITALCPAEAPLLQALHQDVINLKSERKLSLPTEERLITGWLQYASGAPAITTLTAQLQEICIVLLKQQQLQGLSQLRTLLPDRESWSTVLQQIALQEQQANDQPLNKSNDAPPAAPDAADPELSETAATEVEINRPETHVKKGRERAANTLAEGKAIFIENAGLVLLAPFITPFLKACGCLQDKQLTDPYKAIYLLQYLVNGKESAAEFELVLNKIICGIPVALPIAPCQGLPDEDKAEAGKLLQAVIKHWQALKSTSIAGLQQSFLQRQGKLTATDDYWLLQVTQQPYDMLLQHLPWAIQYVKNDWMQQAVKVDWA